MLKGTFKLNSLSTVVCLVTWPLNEGEAAVYLVVIQTSLHKNIINLRKGGRSVS